jgi:hypothetical protein
MSTSYNCKAKISRFISSHPQRVNILGFDFAYRQLNFGEKLEKNQFQLHTAIVICQ